MENFDKKNSAGYLVNYMARLFAKGLNDRLAPLGIVVGQWAILLELWEKDGQRQKDLIGEVNLEQATVANTLSRMERDGLIERKKDEDDARGRRIWLTEKAVDVRDAAFQSAAAQNAQALECLSTTEKKQLNGMMRRVIATLEGGNKEGQ